MHSAFRARPNRYIVQKTKDAIYFVQDPRIKKQDTIEVITSDRWFKLSPLGALRMSRGFSF